jgi:hypothetical protein
VSALNAAQTVLRVVPDIAMARTFGSAKIKVVGSVINARTNNSANSAPITTAASRTDPRGAGAAKASMTNVASGK